PGGVVQAGTSDSGDPGGHLVAGFRDIGRDVDVDPVVHGGEGLCGGSADEGAEDGVGVAEGRGGDRFFEIGDEALVATTFPDAPWWSDASGIGGVMGAGVDAWVEG